jgi:AcrR family transcriptional regulator
VNFKFSYAFSMTALRARQKALRARKIIDAALELFRAKGFDAVRMEDIAVAAEVSPGTVYNYFSTKLDLLTEVILLDFAIAFELGEAIIADPGPDAVDAVNRLTDAHYLEQEGRATYEMFRIALAAMVSQPASSNGQKYLEMIAGVRDQYRRLLERLRADRTVTFSIPARRVARLICNNLDMSFILHILEDHGDVARRRAEIHLANEEVFRLMGALPGQG